MEGVWWGVVRVWRCGRGVEVWWGCGGVVGVWGYKHIKSWLNVILECHISTLMSYCLVLRSGNIAKGRTSITLTEATVVYWTHCNGLNGTRIKQKFLSFGQSLLCHMELRELGQAL